MSTFMMCFWFLISSIGSSSLETTNQGCQMAKLDLVIIVDSSASVGTSNFKEIVKFILELVQPLPVHSDGVRVALVIYSSKANVISYLGDDMSKVEKIAVLGKMKFMPGSTRTDLGIALTREQVLIPERGDRPDVPDQVILLTDGTSTNKLATRDETHKLKTRTGLKIIVLGIGNTLDDGELLEIATSPDLKHVVTDFSQLSGLLKDLESATCEARLEIVTQAQENEVLTTPEEVSVVLLNNFTSETSFDDNYSLYPPSCYNESVYPTEASMTQQSDSPISNIESSSISESGYHTSYSISESGYQKSFSEDLLYPSASLPDTSSLHSVTPATFIYTPESSMSDIINDFPSSSESIQENILIIETPSNPSSSSESIKESILSIETPYFYTSSSESKQEGLLNLETSSNSTPSSVSMLEGLFSFETSSQTGVQFDVTTTVLQDDLISSTVPTELKFLESNILPSSQISIGASIKDPIYDYDVLISSVSSTPDSDSVHLVETKTAPIQLSTDASIKDPHYDYGVPISSVREYSILSIHSHLVSDSVHLVETMLSSTQLSTDASIKDPHFDYDVPISSVREYSILSTHSTLVSNSVHLVETLTSSTPTPPLTPMLMSILIPSSDLFLESVTSSSTIVTSDKNSSTPVSVTLTSTPLYSLDHSTLVSSPSSPVSGSEDDSFASITPTFTMEYQQSQSHVFNTEMLTSVLYTEPHIFASISINSSSVETQNSKTGGSISTDFIYTFVGGGIVGLVALLTTAIILARIFRRRKEEEEVPT